MDKAASSRRRNTPTKTSRSSARMSDVAKIAGVSAMTVSRAIHDPKSVTPETMNKIQEAIATSGYVPNRIAGSLVSRHTNIVVLVVPSLRNSLFAVTIQGVSDILGSSFDLLIADSGYSLKGEEAAMLAFLSQRVCGIVMHNTKHTPRTRRMVRDAGIPSVETGNLLAHPLDMSVGFSNHDAACAMTEYLIAKGYRRIGFVSLILKDNDRASERRRGYLTALSRHGIKASEARMLEVPPGLRSGGLAR